MTYSLRIRLLAVLTVLAVPLFSIACSDSVDPASDESIAPESEEPVPVSEESIAPVSEEPVPVSEESIATVSEEPVPVSEESIAPVSEEPAPQLTHTPDQASTLEPAPQPTHTPDQASDPAGTSVSSDREALVALYNATDGPNWINNTNWLSDLPLATWYGVRCCDAGRVTRLILRDNDLNGELPSELASLTRLSELDLSSNELSGQIPSELASLTRLSELDLSSNELSGQIPSELASLTQLWRLHLHSNELSGQIPSSIGKLTNLVELDLSRNRLSGEIPSSIENLTFLYRLDLQLNQLSSEMPPALGDLPNLFYLFLSGNQWRGCIPLWSLNLTDGSTDLLDCDIPFCEPEDADGTSEATDREALVALYNATDGPNWTNNTNWLSDEPLDEWYGVEIITDRVIYLELPKNNLHGELPSSLASLSRLNILDLSSNELSGQIPSELASLSQLNELDLSSNELSGQIPSELASLSRLNILDLSSNELSGQIPSELASLTRLWGLHLHSNELSGQIPSELGSILHLQGLDLYSNRLSGDIPPQLGNLQELRFISLQDNQLTGGIPPEFGQLAQVTWMYLSGNSLSGEIPFELGNIGNLSRLRVGGGNHLTGCVPRRLRSVEYADLHELGLPYCGQTDPITVEAPPPTDLQPPPPTLSLDPYYGKYLEAGGTAIVSSLRVPDEALLRARNIINEMLSNRPDLLATIAEMGIHVSIWDEYGVLSDLPEVDYDMYDDSTTFGTFNGEVIATGVAQVLCYESMIEPGYDLFVHEFAHGIQAAIEHQPGGDRFRERLAAIYEDALPRWRWNYAGLNIQEFWAEMVAFWFGQQYAKGYSRDMNSPAELEALEPAIAALLKEVFGDATLTSSCHSASNIGGVVVGADDEPIEGIGVFMKRLFSEASYIAHWTPEPDGFDVTSVDGAFEIPVPDGSYILGIYVPRDDTRVECGAVGYITPQGLSKQHRDATRIEVEGSHVTGIEIKVPEEVRDLPRIAACN